MAADLKVFGRAIQKSHSNGRFGLASGHPTTYLPNEGWIRIVRDAFDEIVSSGLLFAFCEAVAERLDLGAMNKIDHRKTKKFPQSGRMPVLCGVVLLWLLTVPARSMVVEVNLGWGYNAAGGADLSDYNLQVGSIVQVIMYDSTTAGAPGSDTDDNFPIYYGNYLGAGIAAEPYPGTAPANVPGDTTMYDPNSTPAGHVLAYTATIQAAPYLDDNGNVWYQMFAQFEVLGTYDSLYIRVFGATDFPNMEVVASYWGLSEVQHGSPVVGIWYVGLNGELDETTATRTNYFEVIPEPGSLSLLALGGAGLLAGARRRRKRARGG